MDTGHRIALIALGHHDSKRQRVLPSFTYVTVRLIFFCTAGRHPSVLMANLFHKWLCLLGVPSKLSHMSGTQYGFGRGCFGCIASGYDQAMRKAFNFWNCMLQRKLGHRLPTATWEWALNPRNREPAPRMGPTIDETFARLRADGKDFAAVSLAHLLATMCFLGVIGP